MSSFVRTIARTVRRAKTESGLRSARDHFDGRGSKLGVTNPRDPCRDRKFKAKPKVWLGKASAPDAKPVLKFVDSPIAPPADHRAKMARKAVARGGLHQELSARSRVKSLLGVPAGTNRRTGKPHEHRGEVLRRQMRGEG